jgi:hypothetical protein
VRTAFHDAVARFGAATFARKRALSSRRVGQMRAPLALLSRSGRVRSETTRRSIRRGRFASHRVNDTELPRPGMPSPLGGTDCSGSPGRCNTTHDQVALANSRVLAMCHSFPGFPGPAELAVARPCRDPLSYDLRALVRSEKQRSPFIGGGGASDADRWPVHGCERRTSISLSR